jgi:glutathione S-transferase
MPALPDAFRMFSRPPPERPAALGYGSYADTLNALEKALTPGPYILGDRFSAADVYIGSQMGFGMMTKSLEPRPVGGQPRCDDRQVLATRAAARSKGRVRSLTPVAMRTALATAGAIGGSPGSPTPLGGFVDGTM